MWRRVSCVVSWIAGTSRWLWLSRGQNVRMPWPHEDARSSKTKRVGVVGFYGLAADRPEQDVDLFVWIRSNVVSFRCWGDMPGKGGSADGKRSRMDTARIDDVVMARLGKVAQQTGRKRSRLETAPAKVPHSEERQRRTLLERLCAQQVRLGRGSMLIQFSEASHLL